MYTLFSFLLKNIDYGYPLEPPRWGGSNEYGHVDPLKPHFYTVKLGFTGVYIIFLFLLKNIDCEYSLEPLSRIMKKYQNFFIFGGKIDSIFE